MAIAYNNKTLTEVVLLSAEEALACQDSNGHLPAGQNGPWNDPDTPVRNTSHWLITFLKAHEITGEDSYHDAAKSALMYLLSAEARPRGIAWHHRNSDKSNTNGLVGQAWSIEAICCAYEAGIGDNLDSELRKVITEHPFNRHLATWEYIDLNGTSQKTMFTLNQQIWFAAMVSRVAGILSDTSLQNRTQRFLNTLEAKISLTEEGTIHHYLSVPRHPVALLSYFTANASQKRIPKPILKRLRPENKKTVDERTIGYHSFCLTGLAILAKQNPNHSVWESNKIKKALRYAKSEEYFEQVSDNRFGFQYNVPGFEIPFSLGVFSDIGVVDYPQSESERWIQHQLERHWDSQERMLSRDTVDPKTLSARIYEATRLLR